MPRETLDGHVVCFFTSAKTRRSWGVVAKVYAACSRKISKLPKEEAVANFEQHLTYCGEKEKRCVGRDQS